MVTRQFLGDQIDQLDLALDQLVIRDRNFDRFAMMLIDNVMELTLHHHAQLCAADTAYGAAVGSSKGCPTAVSEALGQYFKPKVKLATKMGLLPDDAAQSVQYLHSLRNKAHHQGQRHEGILHGCALLYFRLTCLALQNLGAASWGFTSEDRLAHRALKYLGAPSRTELREAFAAAWVRLVEVAAAMDDTLIADLRADMARTIDDTDAQLTFLCEASPGPMTRDEALLDAQIVSPQPEEDIAEYVALYGQAGFNGQDYVRWLVQKYPPQIRKDPLPGWRRRLSKLRAAKDHHVALKVYAEFLQQTNDIREQICEHGSALDAVIQIQVDEALGN
jgi:hypothetical protein